MFLCALTAQIFVIKILRDLLTDFQRVVDVVRAHVDEWGNAFFGIIEKSIIFCCEQHSRYLLFGCALTIARSSGQKCRNICNIVWRVHKNTKTPCLAIRTQMFVFVKIVELIQSVHIFFFLLTFLIFYKACNYSDFILHILVEIFLEWVRML